MIARFWWRRSWAARSNCEQHAPSACGLRLVDKLKAAAPRDERKWYERNDKNGSWLTVRPDVLGETLLSWQEFVDNARICLNLKVLDLPQHCDGCGSGFSVKHALSCNKGGLVSIRHDNVRDEAGVLAELVLPKSRVLYKPFIFHGASTRVGGGRQLWRSASAMLVTAQGGTSWSTRCGKRGGSCILDVRVTDTDAKSYRGSTSAKMLEKAAREKKAKHKKSLPRAAALFHGACLLSRWDGRQGCQSLQKRIANLLAEKWNREYSSIAVRVKTWMALAVVCSNTLLLRGSRARYSWKPNDVDGFTDGAEGVLQED